MVDPKVENACEEVDAMVFSGDGLYSEEALKLFKEYLGRWQRKVPEIQGFLDDKDITHEYF
jgi:hypothetical protein